MTVEARPVVYPFADLVASLDASPQGGEAGYWTSSLVVDFNAVEHWRLIGEVHSLDEQPMPMFVLRRDEFDLVAEPATAVPGEASVSVAGTRFDAEGCREFSRLLAAAADELRSVNADAT